MNARLVAKRPCRLVAGDVRRIPQDERHPAVGYLIACPRCGKTTTIAVGPFADKPGQGFDEATLTLALPAVGSRCGHDLTLRNGTFAP